MAKKKRRGRRAASALSPINKQGIKLGTLLSEVGVGVAGYWAYGHAKDNNWQGVKTVFMDLFNPQKTQGALFLTGLGLAMAGKLTGFRRFGPIQLS